MTRKPELLQYGCVSTYSCLKELVSQHLGAFIGYKVHYVTKLHLVQYVGSACKLVVKASADSRFFSQTACRSRIGSGTAK